MILFFHIIKSGSFTVFHNGVLIQNNVEIKRPTMSIEKVLERH